LKVIQLHLSVQNLPHGLADGENEVAVVVDVLRATSVMATALQNRAREVITCMEIDEVWQLGAVDRPRRLLCGERFCKPISGFDLGNSPGDYSVPIVSGKTLVMTTTNGTRALNAARDAKLVYAAAFVNLSAIAKRVKRDERVTIICAGTDGEETDEDILFAGALTAKLIELQGDDVVVDAMARDALDAWLAFLKSGESLADKLAGSLGGRNLVEQGYRADIEACAAIDSVMAVPMMVSRDPITLRRSP